MDEPLDAADRRRVERRQGARVADLTLPEFRRMLLTSTLFVVVLLLFLWMVRTVVIAAPTHRYRETLMEMLCWR